MSQVGYFALYPEQGEAASQHRFYLAVETGDAVDITAGFTAKEWHAEFFGVGDGYFMGLGVFLAAAAFFAASAFLAMMIVL